MGAEVITGIIFLLIFLPFPVFLFRKLTRAMAELTYQRRELLDLRRELGKNFSSSSPTLIGGELFGERPRLEFNIKGYPCRLSLGGHLKGNLSVSFTMTLEGEGKEIVIDQILNGLGKYAKIEGSEFSKRFSVRSSFPEGATGTISDSFQNFLLSFSEERGSSLSLSCSSRRILFEETMAPEYLSSYLELFDELATMASCFSGTGFSNGGFLIEMVSSSASGKCPVCSTPIGSTRSLCNSCQTPHHPECWTYNEGCAVFACGCTGKKDIYPALE